MEHTELGSLFRTFRGPVLTCSCSGRSGETRSGWAFLAAWVLVFHYLDLYWLIMPTLYPEGAQPDWLDVSRPGRAGARLGGGRGHACRARPLIPIGDPHLSESIAFRNP